MNTAAIEKLRKKLSELEKEQNEKTAAVEVFKKDEQKQWRDGNAAVAELERKVKEIRAPFEAAAERAAKQAEITQNRLYAIPREIERITAQIKTIEDEDSPTFTSVESFRAYLISQGVEIRQTHTMKMVEKALPNGIRLFSHYDSWGSNPTAADASGIAWFAVFEKKIVGFHLTEKGSNKADEAHAWAWIGEPKLRCSTSLEEGRAGLYGSYTTGFKQKTWKAKLMMMSPSKLREIDMSDATNLWVLGQEERPRDYGYKSSQELAKLFYDKSRW